jgi:gamma-glutamyl:cysteine ligase YbdK (ATP-grasp superfamily)
VSDPDRLHLFEGYGIELEYMLVDRNTLSILPVTDRVLEEAAGQIVSDVELGDMAWSNELVLHVIEVKGNGPVRDLSRAAGRFAAQIARINRILARWDGRLMPTGAHPWMNPLTETRLWPHEYSPIYEAYDRIFGCRGHGWSNLQSMHINLPFADDEEFARLHAAIRLLLPIMPALTASSPILEARPTGFLDSRMEVYRHNSRRIPSVAGEIVPEPAFSRRAYQELIFDPMYRDITPLDPEGILRHEFLNSRGAIARFDRGTIEIRVLDTQECPRADLAAAWLISAALSALASETWADLEDQKKWTTPRLASLFLKVVRDAQAAVIDDPDYLRAFGLTAAGRLSAGELWRHLLEKVTPTDAPAGSLADTSRRILERGCLASRILAALGADFRHENLRDVYGALCDCLARGVLFGG